MNLDRLQTAFRTSPAVQLLRAQNAPFILDFLHLQFKAAQRLTVPDSTLRVALHDYQEEVQQREPEALTDSAKNYLSAWCERGFLHRYFQRGETGGEATFQLTSHAETALGFVDRLISDEVGFVGTESRVRLVIESLRDLVVETSEDPKERIRHLESEKTRIESEIERIKRDGTVKRLTEVEVRDRFGVITDLLKQLHGDFRHVEETFKEITRELQQRQLSDEASQRELLGFALEAEALLQDEDQGQSFEAFTRLIFSHQGQEELHELIAQVTQLVELASQRRGLQVLRNTPSQLLAEAQKVMETTQRLSGSLRLLLDDRISADHRRIRSLLGEIRELATRAAQEPPAEREIGLQFDPGLPPFRSPLSRDFFKLPEQIELVQVQEAAEPDEAAREAAFRHYAAMARLDWEGMRHRIREMTAAGRQASLPALLERFPPKSGAIEVVGYLRLAREDGHLIDGDAEDVISLPSRRTMTLPRAVFLPRQAGAEYREVP